MSLTVSSSKALQELREQVLEANLELVRRGLVLYTFGNASGILREEAVVVIKPSGVPYEKMKPEHLVLTDLHGKVLEGNLRPSSDLPTHVLLYQRFKNIGGVVHTHSEYATAWAQARRAIPCLGTTHADYFHAPVPVTDPMPQEEIAGEYEWNTGEAIARAFRDKDPDRIPAVLVANHGPFAWGRDAAAAAHNAVVLESIARMAYFTTTLNPQVVAISSALHDRHFLRKHGHNAYYGQAGEKK
ncbi:MAG TPA: L-ribulose-5-phosphate 4-epimerase [Terriglobales bacterium]|jgi:L-ribulose-5-phosphate 4-epimerase|nr:L-ribulose-5-phosphate 4-epimerase [Terriglobales bacterium]